VKVQVTNLSTPINSTNVVVTLQEYDDSNPDAPTTGPTTLNLTLDPKEAAQYVGGSVYNLTLSKVTPNAS
jgi:hypothetical protein